MLKRLFKFSIYLYVLVLSIFSLAGCNVSDKIASLESSTASNEIYDTPSSDNAITSESVASSDNAEADDTIITTAKTYTFRTNEFFTSHYEKHDEEFGEITKEEYLLNANELINSKSALTKTEEDGDLIYYDSENNEFLVLSTDGYIRTFFKPDAGMDYFNRQ